MRRGLALGGFMGAGKSTVGRVVAEALGVPWYDTDALLGGPTPPPSELARHWVGTSVAAQVASDEAGFRARERGLIEALCTLGRPCVVSTGGGVWADANARQALRRAFVTVTLVAPLDVLSGRVAGAAGRPLWDDRVAERFAARASAYTDADFVVDTERRGVGAVVDEVLRLYAEATSGSGGSACPSP